VGGELGGNGGGISPGTFPGSRIAGYKLEERIGAGGLAVVFKAVDTRLGRPVALKVLTRELGADPALRERFLAESWAAAQIDDPHLIPIYEAGEADGALFIAMRYVAGGDVRSLLRRTGPLSAERTANIACAVASALDAAHEAGLVHRDVKPANMLLDVGLGRPDHVYLTDFGISRQTQTPELTGAGHFLGTVEYAAPEQIRGATVDGRADQYSLACTVFELLTGHEPFARNETAAVIWAQLTERPPLVTRLRPELPRAVDGVLAKALAKSPTGRYATCREFADALCEALGRLPCGSGALHAGVGESTPRMAARPCPEPPACSPSPTHRASGRRRSQPERADDTVSRAVRAAVRPGLLAFNPSAEMIQGRKERVEVGIARSAELRLALAAGLRGRGEPQFEEVDTSPFMGVELKGTAFEITSFSPLEQLVAPLARWEFDVTPCRAGHQTLTLCVSLRVDLINSGLTSGGRIAVPVLERDIRIRVDVAYGTRRFVAANWQWLIVTAAGLGGGIAAWIELFH
jgi:serine/threonine protein kinase